MADVPAQVTVAPDRLLKFLRTAWRQRPDDPTLRRTLATTLALHGHGAEALAHLEELTRESPQDSELVELEVSVRRQLAAGCNPGLPEAALVFLRKLGAGPAPRGDDLLALSTAYYRLGDLASARTCAERISDGLPDAASLHHMKGRIAWSAMEHPQALAHMRAAVEALPETPALQVDLGHMLVKAGLLEEAETVLRDVLKVVPDHPHAHFLLSEALLLKGQVDHEAWAHYEYRFEDLGHKRVDEVGRCWHGEPLQGMTLGVHAMQGAGDAIMFSRFLPLARERGAYLSLRAHPSLERLLRPAPGVDVFEFTSHAECDFVIALGSLPWVLQVHPTWLPGPVPYLRAPLSEAESWAQRLAEFPGLKVGLCWAGNLTHPNDAMRSLPLAAFACLSGIEGLSLFSLQKGPRELDAAWAPAGVELHDFTAELHDWAATAAFVENLDLVISVDTSIAHLAGALGRPTWTLLSRPCDWRWAYGREDTLWYPSMRLFRQQECGKWRPVLGRLARSLNEWALAGR